MQATGKQIILVSRIMVCVYGILSGVFAIILLKFGLSLGWVYLFMGECQTELPVLFRRVRYMPCTSALLLLCATKHAATQ